MMNHPPLNELIDKVGCRYMLVTTVAKRARQLLDEPEKLGDDKPVSHAVQELHDNKLDLEFPRDYMLKPE